MITLLTLAFIVLLIILVIKVGWIILVIGAFTALDVFIVTKIIKAIGNKARKLFKKNEKKGEDEE